MTVAQRTLQQATGPGKVHCDLDNWDFDPRYTDGACPICGWVPPGPTKAKPIWEERFERVPWDYVLLVVLAVVLLVLAFMVGRAAHVNLLPK